MTPATPPAWADVAPGQELAPFVDAPLTITDFVRYQGASGDMNPIHHDEAFARRAGFPTVFAVGMLQAGVLGTYLTDAFGPAAVRRFRVQFREQAWPGDVLTYRARVVARRTVGDLRLVDLALTVSLPGGAEHITGEATVALS